MPKQHHALSHAYRMMDEKVVFSISPYAPNQNVNDVERTTLSNYLETRYSYDRQE